MSKIDELQARIKELEQEKRIAELRLEIARLEAEVAEIRAKQPPCWVWPWWYPSQPWSVPTITYTTMDSANTGYISSATSGDVPKTWTIDGQEYAVIDAPPPGAPAWTPEKEAALHALIEMVKAQ